MSRRLLNLVRPIAAVLIALSAASCHRDTAPEGIDESTYNAEYQDWVASRQSIILDTMKTIGLFPLQEGDTSFGSDPSMAIAVNAASTDTPKKAGIFRRKGSTISVVPQPGVPLQLEDGTAVKDSLELKSILADQPTVLALGSLRFEIEEVLEASSPRRWVTVWDEDRPEARNLPPPDTYSLDPKWRVRATFEAFDRQRSVRIADVSGGFMDLTASGQLVFKLNDREQRLTALSFKGRDDFFVMFQDPTNASATYGYRILYPKAVKNWESTVLDFNFASNPPCAYSRFTTCPLPPPENRLEVPVEAGEKRYPKADGFVMP